MNDTFKDFLAIYKSPFHKIIFDKVKMVKMDRSDFGGPYYHFIGKFRFKPCASILENKNYLNDKDSILKGLKAIDDTFGMEFRKKLTKRIKKNGELTKWTFNFIFDFHPKNIVDFDIDYENQQIELKVYGYGNFS